MTARRRRRRPKPHRGVARVADPPEDPIEAMVVESRTAKRPERPEEVERRRLVARAAVAARGLWLPDGNPPPGDDG